MMDYGSCILLFFHDFQHRLGTQLKAVLKDQAICNGLIFSHTIYVFLKQLFLLICRGSFEFFFIPTDQLQELLVLLTGRGSV